MKHRRTKQDEALISQLVASLDLAVLERIDQSDRFTPRGIVPSWWVSAFGPIDQQAGALIQGHSSFLDHFLHDAERCWAGDADPLCRSGPWTERIASGEPLTLEATALTIHGKSMLVLRRLTANREEAWAMLQHARNQALRHEESARAFAQTESRLTGMLAQKDALQDDLLGVFDGLGLAIIVTDDEGDATFLSTSGAKLLGIRAGALSHSCEQWLPCSKKDLALLRARLRRPGDPALPLTLRINTTPPRWICLDIHPHPHSSSKRLIFLQGTRDVQEIRHVLDDNA